MSQFDLNQLSKKQKASSKKFYQLSMKTKEKEFRHGPFLVLQLFGRILSARKNAMKKSIRN